MGKARIAVVEYAGVPRPRDALEDGCKAVHRDQRRRPPGLLPAIKLGFDAIVVRPKDLADARGLPVFANADVSWNRREFADLGNRRLGARRPVAVDDEARVVLLDQDGIERIR